MFRNVNRTVKLTMVSAVTLGVTASLIALGTHAEFIAQTVSGNNTFQAGVLRISSLGFNGGSFSVSNISPGLKQSNSITLTNNGTLAALMQLHMGAATDAAATNGTCDSSNASFVTSGTTCGQTSLSGSLRLLVYVPTAGGGVCIYPQNGTPFLNGSAAEFTAAEAACGYGALAGSSGFPTSGAPVPFGTSGAAWSPGASQSMVFAIQLPQTIQNEVLGTSTTVDFSWQSQAATTGTASGSISASPTATASSGQGAPTATPVPATVTPTPSVPTPTLTFNPATAPRGATIAVTGSAFSTPGTYDLYFVDAANPASILGTGPTGTGTVTGSALSISLTIPSGGTPGTYYLRAVNRSNTSVLVTSTTTLTITP